MNVSEYLIARLAQAGLEHMFAVPGDYAGPFLEAVDASADIARVATMGELGAGYAADGYGRYKGIGAACVQWGVGTFSLLNCTAGSYVERVPVVVISASPGRDDRELEKTRGILFHHSTGDLRADQRVFENVTVASEIIESADRAPEQIDRAIRALLTHRRPIYLELLHDVQTMTCAEPVGALEPDQPESDRDSLMAAVEAAHDRITAATLPVLWAGVEIQRFGLQPLLQQIVDASGLPFTTTSLAKTVLDESQESFVGTYAGPASPTLTRAVMDAADCPVALGTIITDDYLGIMADRFEDMVEVTIDRTRVGLEYFQGVQLRDFLRGLLARFEADPASPRCYSLPEVPEEPVPEDKAEDRLTYNVFYRQLSAFLRRQPLDDVALVLGESTSLYVFGNLFGLPRDAFVAQAAWGSLGYETGSALGIALAGNRRPWVVAGDGGFRMICQELSSQVQAKCNPVVFVMRNDVYAIEQAFVDIKAFEPDGVFAPFDVLPRWDNVALAKAMGARGFRAETVADLGAVLTEVDTLTDVPALVEIVISDKDLAPQLERLATPPPELRKYRRG